MTPVLSSVFAALVGEWSLQRHIWQDEDAGPLRFVGRAAFAPHLVRSSDVTQGYAYEEAGELAAQGNVLPMRRRYAFAYDAAADAIIVCHWEGGPASALHTLRCHDGSMRAEHRHVCGDDVYDVTYDFANVLSSVPAFVCAYMVRGPRKDYRMRSVFTRSPARAAVRVD